MDKNLMKRMETQTIKYKHWKNIQKRQKKKESEHIIFI